MSEPSPLAVWFQGRRVAPDEPIFPATERGLLYGDGLFETIPVAHGLPLDADRHLARLLASAKALGLPVPADTGLAHALEECLAWAGPEAWLARLTLTRGPGGRGYAPEPVEDSGSAQLLVAAYSSTEEARSQIRDGVRGATVLSFEPGDLARHKTLSALAYVVAAQSARARHANEALLVNRAGAVLETAGSNVFLVRGGRVLTPPTSLPLLAGIGRARTLSWLAGGGQEFGVQGEEWAIGVEDFAQASEAFLTNAVRGFVPLVRLDGRPIGDGRPGPVTRALQERDTRWRAGRHQHT